MKKRALITGSTRGIGKAIATRYLKEGATVVIADVKEELLKDSFQQGAINTYGKMSPMKAHYENLENPYWDVCLSFVENAITAPLYKDGPKIDMQIQTEMQNFLSGSSSVDDFANNMTQYISTMDLSNGMG
jgi:NAD(P)-dependent dehydrogenase (short-subunit alcohol dehydrogenase family)